MPLSMFNLDAELSGEDSGDDDNDDDEAAAIATTGMIVKKSQTREPPVSRTSLKGSTFHWDLLGSTTSPMRITGEDENAPLPPNNLYIAQIDRDYYICDTYQFIHNITFRLYDELCGVCIQHFYLNEALLEGSCLPVCREELLTTIITLIQERYKTRCLYVGQAAKGEVNFNDRWKNITSVDRLVHRSTVKHSQYSIV